MPNMFKNTAVLTFAMMIASATHAQVQMEEVMFKSGKIYTFLAVALVVLAGIFFYLLRLDIKLGKLEKELKPKDRKA